MSSTSGRPLRVGMIGCGNISPAYLTAARKFPSFRITACADVLPERARERAEEYGVPRACSVEELLDDPELDVVLNLTIPAAHAEIALRALRAGKHEYSEKPFALDRRDGREVLELARERGLRVGCAPDTFLGGGIQTCLELINEGAIGEPVAATAFMMSHGHESWHPSPEFYYQPGGGPMFDMGPYYLTALVSLIGPVRRVAGMTRITFPERTITSQPKLGQTIRVEVPTHVAGLLEFRSGAIGTIITTFDVWAAQLPRIEVYGSEGTLSVPDPNTFGGPVHIRTGTDREWREVPLTHGHTEQSRGIGLADMALAIQTGRPHRASGELAYHVLDLMQAFHESSEEGRFVEIESTCERPAPLEPGEI